MEEKMEFMEKHYMNIEDITEETIKSMLGTDGIIIANKNGKIIDIEIHDGQIFTEDGFPLYWFMYGNLMNNILVALEVSVTMN